MSVLLVRFQTTTRQTRSGNNVSSTLFQGRVIEAKLSSFYFNPLCLQFIYLNADAGLSTSTVYPRDLFAIHLKIWKQLMKVAPEKKLFLNFVDININNL